MLHEESPSSQFHRAMQDSNLPAMEALLAAHPALLSELEHDDDSCIPVSEGRTPLGHAYYRGYAPVVRLLRSLSAPYGGVEGSEPSALHWAIAENDVTAVRALLDSGASIEERDPYDETPLIHAAFGGFGEMVRFLVAQGADVTATVEVGDERGVTALHCAYRLPNTVRLLVNAGASVHVRDGRENRTPVETIVEFCGHPGSDGEEALSIVRFYRERGLLSQENRNELLIAAARSGSPSFLEQILQEFGPDWDQKTLQRAGDTARCDYHKAGELIRKLWQAGAVPGVYDAVSYGDLTTLQEALDLGGDPDEMNFNGFETITEAEYRAWCERTAIERPEYIIGDEIRTPLLHVSWQGDIDKARLLLERGAKPDAWREHTPASALWFAADKGNAAMVALLLTYGADANGTNRDGQSVLDAAMSHGDEACIAVLQKAGARRSAGSL